MSWRRAAAAVLAALAALVFAAAPRAADAATVADAVALQAKLTTIEEAAKGLADRIGVGYTQSAGSATCQSSSVQGFDSCGVKLNDATCDSSYGATKGCDCAGRALDKDAFAVKDFAQSEDGARKAAQLMCYAGASSTGGATLDFAKVLHPGVELRANLKSISHRCHLF